MNLKTLHFQRTQHNLMTRGHYSTFTYNNIVWQIKIIQKQNSKVSQAHIQLYEKILTGNYTSSISPTCNALICKALPLPDARNRTKGKEGSVTNSISRKLKSYALDHFKLNTNTSTIQPNVEIAQ